MWGIEVALSLELNYCLMAMLHDYWLCVQICFTLILFLLINVALDRFLSRAGVQEFIIYCKNSSLKYAALQENLHQYSPQT